MKSHQFLIAFALVVLLTACGGKPGNDGKPGGSASGDEAKTGEVRKGEHGGRWLEQGDHAVELAIAEDGTPPKYQAWLYRDGKLLPATAGSVEVRLKRLGNIAENHTLKPQPDGSLMASTIVGEPHSFDVEVLANIEGKALRWAYPSYEGRTVIPGDVATASGIRIAPAARGVIANEHEVQGLVTAVEVRVAKVMARFPGPIRSVRAHAGDRVRAGQILVTVESNLSLTNYNVTSPISGTVLVHDATVGSVASERVVLYEIADLSEVWVELNVFGADAQHVRPGLPVTIIRSDGVTAETLIERVLPGTATASQSTIARATIPNLDGRWRPGSAVKARITLERKDAALVVPLAAVQDFRDWKVVFIRSGDTYEIRPLELGQRDGTNVEVLSGINAGDPVVVEQSYLVKADIEKSGASHDH